MNKAKLFSAIILIMIVNTMVNTSDNLFLGLRYPEMYFAIVVPGIVLSIVIQILGAYVLLEKINNWWSKTNG